MRDFAFPAVLPLEYNRLAGSSLELLNMEEKSTRELLHQWQIESALPGDFNSAVWRRIEKARPASLRRALAEWIDGLFARPAVALSYAGLALVFGLTAGQLQASRDLHAAELQAKSRYLQSIDPYAKPLAP